MSDLGKNKEAISCVECDVTNCIHNNHQNHCTAQSIKIGTQSGKLTRPGRKTVQKPVGRGRQLPPDSDAWRGDSPHTFSFDIRKYAMKPDLQGIPRKCWGRGPSAAVTGCAFLLKPQLPPDKGPHFLLGNTAGKPHRLLF